MGKLHLADNGVPIKDNFIFVPAGFMGGTEDRYVREDVFDVLPETEYQDIMEVLTPLQDPMLGGRAERQARREARRERRRTRRAERRARREDRKDYRMKRGERRQQARERRIALRQEGRTQRTGMRAEAFAPAIASGITKIGSMGAQALGVPAVDKRGFPIGGEINFGTSVWEQYKWPMIIGGAVLLGGIGYIATRK